MPKNSLYNPSGAAAADATNRGGTSGIDAVTLKTDLSSNAFVGAQQAADTVGLSGIATRTDYTIKAGQGDDTVQLVAALRLIQHISLS